MVLSNKKLKQKLRAELAKSLASSVSKSEPKSDNEIQSQSQPQPLKVLLDSVTQRPRMSKREKRRKNLSLRGSEDVNGDSREEEDSKKKEKRKRKREDNDGALGSEKNGVVKKSEKIDEEKKNSEKKKKKKNNNKKKKKGKNEEEKEAAEIGNEEKTFMETNEKNDNSQANGDFATKVYVGGIPYYSTEDDIRSYFEGCGTITEVDCMMFPESGKFRGIAIISFKTEAAAKRALALDGSDMGGLFLTIQPYKSNRTTKASDFAPGVVDGYNRIYVGNLSWDITEDKLRNFFSDCKISSIRFGMDKDTGDFRGYAHVDFSDSLSLTMALKLDQKVVSGRPVRIRCAVPLKKGQANKVKTDPVSVPTATIETTNPSSATTIETADTNSQLSSVSTGKMRRRTCYDCGEKGHISSDCPKKQTAGSVPTTTADTTNPSSVPTSIETADTSNGLSSISTGKMRRRTCYECGEKGHISSDCPKKQKTGLTNATAI